MDQERVTRMTLPQVTVGMPLSLLAWVDDQAERAGLSRSKWIVTLIAGARTDDGIDVESERELAAAS